MRDDLAGEGGAEAALNPAQRLRRAVRNFLMLPPDTRVRIMREEFGWNDPLDWSMGAANREVKQMMNHVRDTGQRQKFIDRLTPREARKRHKAV